MRIRTIEKVALVVFNKPGVLGRVAGHIQHEGWNIKRLVVDEIEDGASPQESKGASRMEIDIESAHTKLAQVMDRLLNLDCVISIEMFDAGGKRLVRNRPKDSALTAVEERPLGKAPPKQSGCFRILAINPGSTSTKFAVYDDETVLLEHVIRHDETLLAAYDSVLKQKEMRWDCIINCLDTAVVDEMDRNAKLTGMPGIERSSVFHALNQKAIARRLAVETGVAYENARYIVVHLGGGMLAYLGTKDLQIVQKMINDGDEFAALVLDSMAYQVSKEIGAMAAVLEGLVDAIILTGGFAATRLNSYHIL